MKILTKNNKNLYNISRFFYRYEGGKEMIEKSIFKDGANKNLTHPKTQKGITLIALITTIVVLLIIAGVAVTSITKYDIIENKSKKT